MCPASQESPANPREQALLPATLLLSWKREGSRPAPGTRFSQSTEYVRLGARWSRAGLQGSWPGFLYQG